MILNVSMSVSLRRIPKDAKYQAIETYRPSINSSKNRSCEMPWAEANTIIHRWLKPFMLSIRRPKRMQKADGSSKATARTIGTSLNHSTALMIILPAKQQRKTCRSYIDEIPLLSNCRPNSNETCKRPGDRHLVTNRLPFLFLGNVNHNLVVNIR